MLIRLLVIIVVCFIVFFQFFVFNKKFVLYKQFGLLSGLVLFLGYKGQEDFVCMVQLYGDVFDMCVDEESYGSFFMVFESYSIINLKLVGMSQFDFEVVEWYYVLLIVSLY